MARTDIAQLIASGASALLSCGALLTSLAHFLRKPAVDVIVEEVAANVLKKLTFATIHPDVPAPLRTAVLRPTVAGEPLEPSDTPLVDHGHSFLVRYGHEDFWTVVYPAADASGHDCRDSNKADDTWRELVNHPEKYLGDKEYWRDDVRRGFIPASDE